MVSPSHFFVLSFLSSRSVPPILSIPFAFPKSFQLSDVLCNCLYLPCLSSLFSLYVSSFSLSFSLSLSLFFSFFLFFSFLFFFLFSLSLSISLYPLSLSLSLYLSMSPSLRTYGREKRRYKKDKNERNIGKKETGREFETQESAHENKKEQNFKKGHLRVWAGSKDRNNVSRFPENDWDRDKRECVCIYIFFQSLRVREVSTFCPVDY